MSRALLAVGALVVFASGVAATPEAPGDYQPPAWPQAPSTGGLVARLGGMTLFTLACAGGALWWARRKMRSPLPGQGPGEAPRVVASVPLAGRCALHLVQVDDTGFVIATDATGLKAIQPLPEPFEELVARGLADAPSATAPAPEEVDEPALGPRRVVLR